mgnify:FL=1
MSQSMAPSTLPILSTTAPPPSTVPFDASTPWWLQGNFAPVLDELDVMNLEVRGAIPPTLNGVYVKNGSNPPRSDSPHWFFGDGMVHGVRLADGKAEWYRNRWVQTQPFRDKVGFGEGSPGGEGNQSNVSALWHGGRLLTSGEVGFPYQLNPDDFSTMGALNFDGSLVGSFTAHPKIDPSTGRMHAFGYGFTAPFLSYYVIEPDGSMSHTENITIPRSTMIHDFQITETDAVFWDLPIVFDMDAAIKFIQDPSSGAMPFIWTPDAGARIGIMPLAGGADAIDWFDIDPCYVFHSVNAFRDGNTVNIDVCHLTSAFDPAIKDIGSGASLRRWTIDTSTRTFTERVLETENPGDLPTRDPRLVGRRHRYGYLVGTRENPDTVEFGAVIKHDFVNDSRVVWDPGPTRHAAESYFVPGDVNDLSDDAGWVLSFIHDDAPNETVLAVFDATDISRGPVAEIVMPRRVPYGFHATFIPDVVA